MSNQVRLFLTGHLRIWEQAAGIASHPRLVFDRHNLIVNEGKGAVMDWFSGLSLGYTASPFNAMVLTNNTSTENTDDTFANAVYGGTNYLSDEGVLHTGASGQVSVTHEAGDPLITVSGTLDRDYGNDVTNNHINSVCLVMGANASTGGPGEANYIETGNERLFARVNVGDLVKTTEKVYTFEWQIQIQTSS